MSKIQRREYSVDDCVLLAAGFLFVLSLLVCTFADVTQDKTGEMGGSEWIVSQAIEAERGPMASRHLIPSPMEDECSPRGSRMVHARSVVPIEEILSVDPVTNKTTLIMVYGELEIFKLID
jgi:hypothetical protein